MSDVLIRDVPDEVLAGLDRRASRLGISRAEYIRRRLAQEAASEATPVTAGDLEWFASHFADLADPDVMEQAWGRRTG